MRPTGPTDLQLLQRDCLWSISQFGDEWTQFLSRRYCAIDIQRQLSLIRPTALRPRDRAYQPRCGIEIKTIRSEFSFGPRALPIGRIGKRQPPFNAATLDIRLQLVEGNLL